MSDPLGEVLNDVRGGLEEMRDDLSSALRDPNPDALEIGARQVRDRLHSLLEMWWATTEAVKDAARVRAEGGGA